MRIVANISHKWDAFQCAVVKILVLFILQLSQSLADEGNWTTHIIKSFFHCLVRNIQIEWLCMTF